MSLLKNKITLITGASAGIGKACAEVFAKEKSNLILAARRIERVKHLQKN
jgi:3-hydroxy acid dehydrogenase / malonic semialdehyde reductase